MINEIKRAMVVFLCLSGLTGLLYPLCMTGLANVFFPWQAQGSLIYSQNKVIGSTQIGQFFSEDRYFWGRPSATSAYPYNPMASGGSNLGPSNPNLIERITQSIQNLTITSDPIPVDLVTTSGSGLDPDISPEAALYQIPRVSKARHLSTDILVNLIQQNTSPRTLGIWGEPRVNVLALNLALDQVERKDAQASN